LLVSEFPLEERLSAVLIKRETDGLLRKLQCRNTLVDFVSNDYLGFAKSTELQTILEENSASFIDSNGRKLGSTGSRLLSGNSQLAEEIEEMLAGFHQAQAALLFNSGYDANLGCISALIRPGDIVFYDELVHASMHDGLKLTKAQAIPFRHNDMNHLEHLLNAASVNVFILLETVYSMEGDLAPLSDVCDLAEKFGATIIADEAHATGVFGENGRGLANLLGLEKRIFARVITFSKALGVAGAAVLTTSIGKEYLVNFARSFIYSTAPSFSSLLEIKSAYLFLKSNPAIQKVALDKILFFKDKLAHSPHLPFLKESESMIQALIIPGNFNARSISFQLALAGFDLRPLVFPTVPKGRERIRICLHTFNNEQEIEGLLYILTSIFKM
jgi:8-amino-7-oxononanoate synthase